MRVFTLRLMTLLTLSYPQSALQRFWSDCVDAQADLSLRWAHMLFCSRCFAPAPIILGKQKYVFEYMRHSRLISSCASTYCDSEQHWKIHYENTPIQIYWKFYNPKKGNFQSKNVNIFLISAQNIDCRYSLEPPRRGGSNEYPQSMFWAEIRKIMYTPVNPSFII